MLVACRRSHRARPSIGVRRRRPGRRRAGVAPTGRASGVRIGRPAAERSTARQPAPPTAGWCQSWPASGVSRSSARSSASGGSGPRQSSSSRNGAPGQARLQPAELPHHRHGLPARRLPARHLHHLDPLRCRAGTPARPAGGLAGAGALVVVLIGATVNLETAAGPIDSLVFGDTAEGSEVIVMTYGRGLYLAYAGVGSLALARGCLPAGRRGETARADRGGRTARGRGCAGRARRGRAQRRVAVAASPGNARRGPATVHPAGSHRRAGQPVRTSAGRARRTLNRPSSTSLVDDGILRRPPPGCGYAHLS